MGHYNKGNIHKFWPDDDHHTMYVDASVYHSMSELIEKINEKWPNASLDNVTITSEKIHTDCLTYDRYDPSDYTDFLVITYACESE